RGCLPFIAIRGAHLTPSLIEGKQMAGTSELIEFRRAFVWLLCGMLLPSVALVAFGVVAVANERAAVERRLAEEYDARLRALGLELLARLDKSAEAIAATGRDPLVYSVRPLDSPAAELADAARRTATLPIGGHVFASAEIEGERRAFRNRTLYIALLLLLYLGIGVGFGLTIREMRRAYKLSRLKTDFVANISHELRTPLTSVRLFAETLRDGRAESPEEVRECVT